MNLFMLENVTFKNILTYPTITIKEHAVTFLLGRSGCGKSTLLKLLNQSISPDTGEIFYKGKRLREYNSIHLRREVILVSQNVFLFEGTIRDNFNLFYEYRELLPLEEEKVQEYLRLCMVENPLDAVCSEMSGGERQRVLIAICLSFMPNVLLLDEPTSALDKVTAHALMKQVTSYGKEHGMSFLIISHDPSLMEICGEETIRLGEDK